MFFNGTDKVRSVLLHPNQPHSDCLRSGGWAAVRGVTLLICVPGVMALLPGLLSSSANSQHAHTRLVKVYTDISLNLT